MAINSSDRIAFSLKIVQTDSQISALLAAQALIQSQLATAVNLDNANKNLMSSVTSLISSYQSEYNQIDGNVRTITAEQNILDAANKILQNYFFPNDTTNIVPSLSATRGVWTQALPFALNYAIGKNYLQSYSTNANNEDTLIAAILSYTPYVPTPPPGSGTPTATVIATVNSYITVLGIELAAILTNDTNPTRQSQNNAAIVDINNNILPALNSYLSTNNLATLQSAVITRSTFLSTRVSQLNTNLGSISQDVTTGVITASGGFYGTRYGYLNLRLNIFTGSLSNVTNIKNTITVQNTMIQNLNNDKAFYKTVLPTSLFQSPGNGTSYIQLSDTSFLSVGDLVYVYAEGQTELTRAIKSISGSLVLLNDTVPAKYDPTDNSARLYKDIT